MNVISVKAHIAAILIFLLCPQPSSSPYPVPVPVPRFRRRPLSRSGPHEATPSLTWELSADRPARASVAGRQSFNAARDDGRMSMTSDNSEHAFLSIDGQMDHLTFFATHRRAISKC